MATDVLIVDESPLCRELLTSVLAAQGYHTAAVAPHEAESALVHSPSVIVLEPGAAGSDGWGFLDIALRGRSAGPTPGVVILTDQSDKGEILRAAQFGVRDYMLKQRFSLPEFLTRVRRHVAPSGSAVGRNVEAQRSGSSSNPLLSSPPQRHADADRLTPVVTSGISELERAAVDLGLHIQTGKATLDRLFSANLKALPGAVADVMTLASSPRGTIAELAQILLRDPVLSAGTLRVANSAAFSSHRGRVSNVEDAVKKIGVSGVRNLVVNVGIFNAFSSDTAGGLWVPRVWQHCIGAAMLMEKLAPRDDSVPAGAAYLVGLCHDLADIILRQKFVDQYAATETLAAKTHCTYREAFLTVFGLPYAELISRLLSRLRLPALITVPIEEFFDRGERRSAAGAGSLLGRSLRATNVYAHGLLLAPSYDDFITPLTRMECRNTFGDPDPRNSDDQIIRGQAIATAAGLAGLSMEQTEQLCEPMVPRYPLRICYCRHADYSTLDPLEAFLRLAAREVELTAFAEEIDPEALDGCDAIVVTGGTGSAADDLAQELARVERALAARAVPVLYLRRLREDHKPIPGMTIHRLPISVRSLSSFLAGVAEKSGGGAVEHAA